MIKLVMSALKHMRHTYKTDKLTVHSRVGAQWFSGRVLGSRPRGRGFESHQRHFVVVLGARHIYPSLVLGAVIVVDLYKI